jgi:hypothetical protein
VQAAAAAAAGDGDGVRRSKRATAGKKAPDIMFTQGKELCKQYMSWFLLLAAQ